MKSLNTGIMIALLLIVAFVFLMVWPDRYEIYTDGTRYRVVHKMGLLLRYNYSSVATYEDAVKHKRFCEEVAAPWRPVGKGEQ